MHFLFMFDAPGILGGSETLIARMAGWLNRQGHDVTLLVNSAEHWSHLVPKDTRCIVLRNRFRELYFLFHAKRLWKELNIAPPDVIKSFDLPSSWAACVLSALLGNPCKVVAGLYCSLEFKHYCAPKTIGLWGAERLMLRNYLKNIPASARVFCGVDQIEELEEVYQQKGRLWPIPIDASCFDRASRRPKRGKIVSVGRLAPMKDYNLYMIEVVRELRNRGRDVTWSVYGEGQYESVMRERIRQYGLERAISIEGSVPYRRLWQVLEDAYVFVGMGTAILEAALFKVPNVCAGAYDKEGLTYGPVYRLPPGSVGQRSTVQPAYRVVDEIERILRLSPSEYDTEQERVYRHAQSHELEASMRRFVELAQAAAPVVQDRPLYFTNYAWWFVRQAMRKCGVRRYALRNDNLVRAPGSDTSD